MYRRLCRRERLRVFVTGGTGFVGRYVVRELLGRGHDVFLGVRNVPKARALFGEEAGVYEVNFGDRDSVREVLRRVEPDAIVHLIGILAELRRRGITFEKVHYLYSVNLYGAAKELGIGRALHMSALGTHDEAPSRYHQTKRWAEKFLMESGISYTVFRPSLILGPEQRLFSDMDRITRILPVVALPGWGDYLFQPVDVRDVAQCFAEALDRGVEGIYELCGNRRVTFKKLLKDVFSYLGRKVLMVPLRKRLMFYMGKLMETFVEPPPFSSDQILMMWRDNVCGALGDANPRGVEEMLGRAPIPYEESLRWSLESYLSNYSSE